MVLVRRMIFRDRSLLNALAWDAIKRGGFKKWLNYELKNMLIICDGLGEKFTIWFDLKELENIDSLILKMVQASPEFMSSIIKATNLAWKRIGDTIEDFDEFYKRYISYWEDMSILRIIPDIKEIPKKLRDAATACRMKYESLSDHYDNMMQDYVKKNYPQFTDYLRIVTPDDLHERDMKRIIQRKDGWAIHSGTLILKKDLPKLLEEKQLELEKIEIPKSNILLGSPAYGGHVKGIVRIIKRKDEVDKIQEGEILISDMTTPDFLPAMKKAAAFVTDEGGVTCHAAITAREMKKPCIVGTNIATQMFKNGDIVEVNADKGIVKKIN